MNKIFSSLAALLFVIFFSSCGSLAIPQFQDEQANSLKPGHGIYAVVLNTIEKINHLSFESSVAGSNFVLKWPDIGENIYLFEVPEGEYCLQRVNFPQGIVSFRDPNSHNAKGICTIVEEDSIAYSDHIYIRLNTKTVNQYPNFVYKLNREYPNICQKFIGDSCGY